MELQKTYTTHLESITQDTDVIAILDHKCEDVGPARTVDYIGLALDNVDKKMADINAAIKQLQEMKKHEDARKEHIKEQTCNWLEGTGLDKLDGLIVSSMSINNTKPKEELIITDEESCINAGYFKTVLDKSELKKDLLEGKEVEGAKIEVIHVANKIKINKKRGA